MSMMLKQSATFRPFMEQLSAFAGIARRAGNNQIARIIRSSFGEGHNMVYMVGMLALPQLLFTVVAPIALSFELISNIMGGKAAFSAFLECTPSMAFCTGNHLPTISFFVCLSIQCATFTYIISVLLVPLFLILKKRFPMTLLVNCVIRLYSFPISRIALFLLCIDPLFIDGIITSSTCIDPLFIFLIMPSSYRFTLFTLCIATLAFRDFFFMLFPVSFVFRENIFFVSLIIHLALFFYLFLVFFPVLLMLFFMSIIVTLSVCVEAYLALPIKSINTAVINRKVLGSSRRYIFALSATLHPFRNRLFYNDGLSIFAGFTRRVPPVFLLWMLGKVGACGRKPFLTFEALLQGGIALLRYNNIHGETILSSSRPPVIALTRGTTHIYLPQVYHKSASQATLSPIASYYSTLCKGGAYAL